MIHKPTVAFALTFGIMLLPPAAWSAGNEQVLYAFQGGSDGAYPMGGVINVHGTLYGTTSEGGTANAGTVFAISPDGKETVLHTFQGGSDGDYPVAGVIDIDGKLYGTTEYGGGSGLCGSEGCGTVFSLDLKTGLETVLYRSSGNTTDGCFPAAGMIDVEGKLYGTTRGCGASNHGTVFSLDLANGAYRVVHAFADRLGHDGADPQAGLIDVGGKLYGTTASGGKNNTGTVFALNPTTGATPILYAFGRYEPYQHPDGDKPRASLVDVDGTLYGTTSQGGTSISRFGVGTVFAIGLPHDSYRLVYTFRRGHDGAAPFGSLVAFGDKLIGTTLGDGTGRSGTVFSINPETGNYRVVYAFESGGDGASPYAGLLKVGGTLYGTTENGGGSNCRSFGCGTVFALTP